MNKNWSKSKPEYRCFLPVYFSYVQSLFQKYTFEIVNCFSFHRIYVPISILLLIYFIQFVFPVMLCYIKLHYVILRILSYFWYRHIVGIHTSGTRLTLAAFSLSLSLWPIALYHPWNEMKNICHEQLHQIVEPVQIHCQSLPRFHVEPCTLFNVNKYC